MIQINNSILIKDILKQRGSFFLPLKGKSMEPTYYEGDIIQIIISEEIQIGDIILFEINELVILHRVIDIFEEWIVTKGDNHQVCDDMIHRTQVLGKVAKVNNSNNVLYSKDEINKFIFSIHNYTAKDNLKDILNSSDIIFKQNLGIQKDNINIGVIALANNTINDIQPQLKFTNKPAVFHFNIKVSNIGHNGYYSFNDFDYLIRIGKYIPNSLMTINQQIMVLLGMLYGIGEKKYE